MAEKLAEKMMMMIFEHVEHTEYERVLNDANLSVEETMNLSQKLYYMNESKWRTQEISHPHGVNPFDVISFLEARVALLVRTGDDGYADWMRAMFDLANRYSDQAGLERKFDLYTELIESTKSDLLREERSVFFYTRALNRLAQLTEYWHGEDEARPLWQELTDYAIDSIEEEDEQHQALNVIRSNAPWFAEENNVLFQF
jgi:hypothetical protein